LVHPCEIIEISGQWLKRDRITSETKNFNFST
jgi:hypothetical protein